MSDFQPGGVQKLPFETVLFAKLFVKVKVAVSIVHYYGVTDRCEVKPDLMHAPGFDVHPRQRRL